MRVVQGVFLSVSPLSCGAAQPDLGRTSRSATSSPPALRRSEGRAAALYSCQARATNRLCDRGSLANRRPEGAERDGGPAPPLRDWLLWGRVCQEASSAQAHPGSFLCLFSGMAS